MVGTVSAASPSVNGTTVHEGDIATFTVNTDGRDNVRVQIGEEDAGYRVNLTVDSGWGENTVKIRMNTYKAGGWTGASADEVFSASDGSVSATRSTEPLSEPIETANYRMYTYSGSNPSSIGILSIKERNTNDLTVSTAPRSTNVDSLDTVNKRAVTTSQVAKQDYLITNINASGLEGYIQSGEDLEQGSEGVSLEVTYSEPNQEAQEVNFDAAQFYQQGSHTYLIIETDGDDFEPGTTYDIKFKIDGDDNPYVEDGEVEQLEGDVTVQSREIDFKEDPVVVGATKKQNVELSTTVAPGTKFQFTAISESVDNAFVKQASATVTENRSLTPTFNFQDISGKTGFELSIKNEGVKQQGYVGGNPAEQTTTPVQSSTTETPEATTTTTVNKTAESTAAETTNSDSEITTTVTKTTSASPPPENSSNQSETGENGSVQNGSDTQPQSSGNAGGGGIVNSIKGVIGKVFGMLGVNGIAISFSLMVAGVIYKLA
jgi:hypothetical protein